MLLLPYRCIEALIVALSSALNASKLRHFSRVLVLGFLFSFLSKYTCVLKNCRNATRSLQVEGAPSKLGLILPSFNAFNGFLFRISKLFSFTNLFLQLTRYFKGNREKSCLPVDRSRIWWCCLIAASHDSAPYFTQHQIPIALAADHTALHSLFWNKRTDHTDDSLMQN